MTGLDWTSYEAQPAPRTLLCQFRRQDGKHLREFVGYAKDFLPEFDIAGLKWRLTGIAREELDGMPEAVREQVMPPTNTQWLNVLLGQSSGFGSSIQGLQQFPSQAEVDGIVARMQIGCAQTIMQMFADCFGGARQPDASSSRSQEAPHTLSTLDKIVLGMYNPWALAEWVRRNKPVKL
jgi:hypothetical protein